MTAVSAYPGATVDPSPVVQRLIHKTNWGAALLAGFWTFAHGVPVLGVLYWLFLLPLPPVSIGIMVYLLFNGNRIALERRIFESPEQFLNVQRAWTIAGFITFPFELIAFLIYVSFIVSLLSSAGPPP